MSASWLVDVGYRFRLVGSSSWDSGDDMVLVDVVETSVSFSSKKILVSGSKNFESRVKILIEEL